ncbi:MAG: extracellular solute-binding protein [Gammaproteobacteria bacterium]|nr:extracellular solute-binding protein [Gammaproteobacteria bacterium]
MTVLLQRLAIGINIFWLLWCSNLIAKSSVEPVTINLTFTHENQQLKQLLQEFAVNEDFALTITWMDQAKLKSQLMTSSKSQIPDALICPADNLGLSGYVSYSKIPQSLIDESFDANSLATVTLNKEIFGVPLVDGNHLLLFYNRRLVKTPASTWSELLAQNESLPKNISLIGWSFMEMYWFTPFITAFGEPPLIKNLPHLNTPAMQQALQFVWQLNNTNIVDGGCDYECVERRFINGDLAYTINGIWAYKNFSDRLKKDLGVMRLPAIQGNRMRPYHSTIALTFPNDSLFGPKQKALQALLKMVQQERFQQRLWQDLNDIPARPDVAAAIRAKVTPNQAVLFDALETSVPMPSHKNMSIVWEAMLQGYTRYGNGEFSAQQASAYMQKIAEKAISPISHLESP